MATAFFWSSWILAALYTVIVLGAWLSNNMTRSDFLAAIGVAVTILVGLGSATAQTADTNRQLAELNARINIQAARDSQWTLRLTSMDPVGALPATMLLVPTFEADGAMPVVGDVVPIKVADYTRRTAAGQFF